MQTAHRKIPADQKIQEPFSCEATLLLYKTLTLKLIKSSFEVVNGACSIAKLCPGFSLGTSRQNVAFYRFGRVDVLS